MPRLERLPALADVELGTGRQPPLVDPEHGEPADIGIDLDLEDMGEHMLARVGNRNEVGGLATAGGRADVGRRVAFGGVGQQLDDHLDQLGAAPPAPFRTYYP